jgi:regulator of sigma E protease
VDRVSPDGAAWDVEMRAGDVILSIDGTPVRAFSEMVGIVEASEGRALLFEVWREGQALDFAVVPRRTDLPAEGGGFETSWKVGLGGGLAFEVERTTPSPGAALAGAVGQLGFVLSSSLQGMWSMVTGAISTCNLSGPVGIAEASGAMASQGPASFLWFLAVLSAAVGLMNLFPIPVLDGGHLVFHAWEALTGRPPGERALRALVSIGLTAILALTVFAVANDLVLCP